jgi:translocation and assembly module TamA
MYFGQRRSQKETEHRRALFSVSSRRYLCDMTTTFMDTRRFISASVLCGLLGLLAQTLAAEPVPDDIFYRTRIRGVSWVLRHHLKPVCQTLRSQNDPPPFSIGQLRKRAERDRPRLQAVLESLGYYEADITLTIDTGRPPAHVTFQITPGPVYKLGSVVLCITDGALPSSAPALRLRPGTTARADNVREEHERLIQFFHDSGYPFAEADGIDTAIDPTRKLVDVSLRIRTGLSARFGALTVHGLTSVAPGYITNGLPWRTGAVFRLCEVTDLERKLLLSGVFSSVHAQPQRTRDIDGLTPVSMDVLERKHRTIRIGGNYRTDTGFGGNGSWEHRNLFGGGEKLEVTWEATEIDLAQGTRLEIPHILRPDWTLINEVREAFDHPDAYDSRNVEASSTLQQKPRTSLTTSEGLATKYSNVEQADTSDTFVLFSVPLALEWDSTNDRLDPTHGWRWRIETIPFRDTMNDARFLRSRTCLSHYIRLADTPGLVAALRAAGGMIYGAERDAVPADERLYAGGSGSLRGYQYQTVGPLIDGEPTGGLSVVEAGAELRARITRRMGLTLFGDGGTAYSTLNPAGGDEPFLWSVGIGMRYFTGIGPLRFDFAVPLDRRQDIDDPFQVYVSLGQAF